jgi:hypothetical protein
LIEYLTLAIIVFIIGTYLVYQSATEIRYVPKVGQRDCGFHGEFECTEQEVKMREDLRRNDILKTLGYLAGFSGLEVLVIWKGRKAKLKSLVR